MQLEHDIVEICWSILQVLERSVAEDEINFQSSLPLSAQGLWESWEGLGTCTTAATTEFATPAHCERINRQWHACLPAAHWYLETNKYITCVCSIPYYLARFSCRKLCIGATECRGWRQTPVNNSNNPWNVEGWLVFPRFPQMLTDARRIASNQRSFLSLCLLTSLWRPLAKPTLFGWSIAGGQTIVTIVLVLEAF